MNRFTGGCHCGNIDVVFETPNPAQTLEVRACACSFCRKHGARTATDPAGRLRLTVADGRHLDRYLFGQRSAEFLICNKCGVFVAAIQEEPEGLWGVLNINTRRCERLHAAGRGGRFLRRDGGSAPRPAQGPMDPGGTGDRDAVAGDRRQDRRQRPRLMAISRRWRQPPYSPASA